MVNASKWNRLVDSETCRSASNPRRGCKTTCARALVLLCVASWNPDTVAAQLAVRQVLQNHVPNTYAFGGAMDADGDTLVVGAPAIRENGIQRGAVSIFVDVAGTWVLQQTLTRNTGLAFGSSVAVSGDTLIAATQYYSPFINPGPLVFVRTGGTWIQQAELRPSNATVLTGARVALDGDTALVSTVERGVYAFVRSGTVWTQQQQLLPETAGSGSPITVAFEGETAFVGVPRHFLDGREQQGVVHIYTRAGGVWTRQATLAAPAGRVDDSFGFDIALSGDTALVLGGEVYQFTRTAGSWVRQPSLILPPAPILTFYPLSVTLGGDTAIVTVQVDPRAPPYAYVYRRIAERWLRLESPVDTLNYASTTTRSSAERGSSGGRSRHRVLRARSLGDWSSWRAGERAGDGEWQHRHADVGGTPERGRADRLLSRGTGDRRWSRAHRCADECGNVVQREGAERGLCIERHRVERRRHRPRVRGRHRLRYHNW